MSQDDKPVNHAARKRVAFLILIASVLGFLIIRSILSYFEELKILADHDPELAFIKLKRFSSILLIVNAVATSVFAFYFMSMGWRTWKSVQFPPPGTRVLRASRIQVSTRAKIIALICLFLALLILSTNVFMWYFYTMLERATNLADCSAREMVASPHKEIMIRLFCFNDAVHSAQTAPHLRQAGSVI